MRCFRPRLTWSSVKWFRCCSGYCLSLLLMGLCLFVLLLNVYELHLMQADHNALHDTTQVTLAIEKHGQPRSIVWVYGKQLEFGYMKHVFSVFERIGFKIGGAIADWDVLWSHEYPFLVLSPYLGNLKPHQRVNHFPGTGALTNKVSLVSSNLSFIPKAFRMPQEKEIFIQYATENKKKHWVQKSNSHRGVKIKSIEELDLNTANKFVQEYVDDPFLIDGRRFDIGLYVALTSVDPLRVYLYQGDWLVRFCSKDYLPFDSSDTDKYVITDDYTPLWEIPSLSKLYTDFDSSRKTALLTYLERNGKDPKQLERSLADAVRRVMYSKESAIKAQTVYYRHRNFFEMMRFDFLVDNDLKVYLMEVNMSPNLSSRHFAGNVLLYEQVIFSLLNLVGIATVVKPDYKTDNGDAFRMQVSSKDLRVYAENCTGRVCRDDCQPQICRLCSRCADDLEPTLTAAYLEHVNRLTWRRIIPKPHERRDWILKEEDDDDDEFRRLSEQNQLMTLWFRGKCLEDVAWCS